MNYATYHDNLITEKRKRELPPFLSSNIFRIFLTLLAFVLLILYVVRLSTVSVKGYDISALQKQVKILQDEENKLQFEIAKNGSMQSIQNRLKTVQFVPAEKPEFAVIAPPIVAVR
ncbi:MAG: hypothetical protein A3B90_00135 [Candidatus Magasanikbacteria bacterium RIFCSPHIGHO2_02_FULL_41_13]|uniref:Cell division protein FtsL n=1 Tax=Candidatus Magasanikbacteria bacterium RIFCSPHIGHO2_02_FULL_41_13 TaxID=1798676 RepID=A0A1F6M448_9BACT|nr:MAG: hypothetical protein A3B90_00135 [Candidatus Magasanikbacteria bacterium RIFCSPHIGHO2_02_FULL_41_13]